MLACAWAALIPMWFNQCAVKVARSSKTILSIVALTNMKSCTMVWVESKLPLISAVAMMCKPSTTRQIRSLKLVLKTPPSLRFHKCFKQSNIQRKRKSLNKGMVQKKPFKYSFSTDTPVVPLKFWPKIKSF